MSADNFRKPLKERGHRGSWTPFEAKLFNLIAEGCRESGQQVYFSRRLRIAQALLDQFDAEIAYVAETGAVTWPEEDAECPNK